YEYQPSDGEGGFVQQQENFDQTGGRDVEGRENRIADGAVRALEIRLGAAQPEETGNRQDIEQQNCKDNIIEQIVILPAQREQSGQYALDREGEYRGVTLGVERASAF